MAALRELVSAKGGRVLIDPKSVVSVSSTDSDPDKSYVELTSGNTFPVVGSVETVVGTLGLS